MRSTLFCTIASLFLACVSLPHSLCNAQDWTQWGGAQRDFNVDAEKLPKEINLSETWRRTLGEGYSAILVEKGKLYSMYRNGDEELVICMAEPTGQTVWEHSYAAPMNKEASTSFGKGPNSTPIIVGDSIITIGFNADIHCLDKNSGKVRWNSNLISELGGTNVDMGYSQSPIVYKGTLILPLGGTGKGIVGMSLKDGSLVWSAQDFKNSYSTPILATVEGVDQMIFVMTDEVISVNPDNGELFWTFPLENQWSTHAFVPLWDTGSKMLFVSSFRQSHGLRLKREDDKMTFEPIWSIPSTGIGFTTAVIVKGIVIGTTGGSSSPLVTGIELETGKILWRERGFRSSNYLAAGDRVILLDENGVLAIAKPTPAAFNVVQKQQVLNAPKAWTVPTMVGNRLFMRDQKEIVRFELN